MSVQLINRKYYTNEKFNIEQKSNHKGELAHTHDFVEFVYMFKGKCTHIVDKEEYLLCGGDALFINYGSEHTILPSNGIEYVDIIIKPEYINTSLKGSSNAFSILSLGGFDEFKSLVDAGKKFIHFSSDEQKRMETLIDILLNEQNHGDPGGEVIRRSLINTILTMVFRKMSFEFKNKMNIDNELLIYINENCQEALTLKKIAELCFYNPAYFSRAFKKFAGVTFSEYLLKARIKKAHQMLENSDMKVETVMQKCGFTNRTRFFDSFMKETGLTPLGYKKSKK